jgi:hypothetical protein
VNNPKKKDRARVISPDGTSTRRAIAVKNSLTVAARLTKITSRLRYPASNSASNLVTAAVSNYRV